MATYEVTKDPNIIKRVRVVEDEVHLDKLRERVRILEGKIERGEGGDKWYAGKLAFFKSLLKELEALKEKEVEG